MIRPFFFFSLFSSFYFFLWRHKTLMYTYFYVTCEHLFSFVSDFSVSSFFPLWRLTRPRPFNYYHYYFTGGAPFLKRAWFDDFCCIEARKWYFFFFFFFLLTGCASKHKHTKRLCAVYVSLCRCIQSIIQKACLCFSHCKRCCTRHWHYK